MDELFSREDEFDGFGSWWVDRNFLVNWVQAQWVNEKITKLGFCLKGTLFAEIEH